ncbi:ABC transporter substrate-binding protein [Nocardioides sp. GXZ039]|uniref:ABC transporter substrate-binding protein n=1 Tax=Nocardioides sp. GXZ039 TaxID=3136018 RepID=UPI0030F3E026
MPPEPSGETAGTPAAGHSGHSGRGALTRRRLLQAGGGLAALGIGGAALKLPFFGTAGATQDPATCKAADVSSSDKRLLISNWPAYIDPVRKKTSTVSVFEERTGIDVTYTDDVNDNAEYYAKVRNQLADCQPINTDMFMLTDWMAARMISLGWIQPLDKAAVPNLHKNLIKPLRGVQWDPDLTYHAPWQSGLTGLAYNSSLTGEVRSFEELLTRSDLKGRVTLLSEMRDTMAFMLRVDGADPDNFTQDQWDNAIDHLRKVVDSGQIRSFTGNDYLSDLAAGNTLACEAWSGDVIAVAADNPDIKFVAPEEGLSLWSDNMLIPNKATHQANAEEWINYYYEPEVAAKLAAWVWYICPVEGARQAMEKVDPSLVDDPLIFPDEAMLKDTFDFMPLDDRQTIDYERDWANVTGG